MSGSDAPAPGSWQAFSAAAIGSGQLSLDPDKMRECINYCNDYVEDLQQLQNRASRELYYETLGIGEADIETSRLIVQKFQHKARGGGQIADESSAVGYLQAHIDYALDLRDSLQAVLDAYLTTDAQSADGYHSIGTNQ
ncbi:hypothetical protein G4H71_04755 [Rhodococcus triatomae]|uniref:PE family protein n=1 Tax=Rhodococcus triatomae TaxID=300028 RepID=A0A1G7ZZS1_9NOCA|nr:hypothetical protein [Rhodococcus triatomae]QNG17900.1 hypothetical protein G4H72_03290 [Rhodococcus triatomae]QNG22432.1 hypothetical protein G4H71_04755 [Rhodococcus triatomae]SDH14111.1 hypothetical protein SAMN05444695_101275 [Rhodococcus triatomae]